MRSAYLFLTAASSLLMTSVADGAAKKSANYCNADAPEMVDTSFAISDSFAQAMQSIGVRIVARYYDYQNETLHMKRLRPSEIPILKHHHLQLLVVFQHNNDKAETFRNWRTRGPADANQALKLARQFKQPDSSAIYFGVDNDFVGSGPLFYNQNVISYFTEVGEVLGKAGFDVGVYGSGATCEALTKAHLVTYCWISHSHAFAGTKSALAAGAYNIEQYLPAKCGGRSVDFDDLKPGTTDVGQFEPG